ncbi:bifunctional [glutamate--ammonia ligase]-adenylyl-L-tyrosine phosphorylase/[glutamate--ammonia-ligase] adenylyltransferase [Algibacillus agarilyticus]|uniref:bifunctional [glutamate--ammonia ligase]-adenylyl-L-tyrosine phosphorylase/[glutamate--ammonia-ligase] adenylyltransferase n=1 Tax=Algibacillus agarilyticus TaxID=2234133 RepID=UPI000DD075D3|nr:bifunctional [glutamate--ammonia ligase]-adenylyl-L-tyrosine phosphorylase/[glutamate--ammonia-ligase] adenylyltransferase [Algibacillus agarilyticus]
MTITDNTQWRPSITQWSALPATLQSQADLPWQALTQAHPAFLNLPASQIDLLKWHFSMSQFIADSCIKANKCLIPLLNNTLSSERLADIEQELSTQLQQITTEDELRKLIRQIRREQMLIIAWRDLNGQATLDESFKHISGLAELLISYTLNWLYQHYQSKWGKPTNAAGEEQAFYVLGMGKLGGGELNFSSDIDLIFCYPDSGYTQGGTKELDNQSYFTRLGQKLIAALNQQTMDGFVYRVDMRLRPNGESGPLAMSFAMLEDYYQSQGRDWERYAMIKAKIITSKQWYKTPTYNELAQLYRPFVYRKYIDFSAIDSLRKMKKLISQEVKRKGLQDNIKLGAGGIREIEFIAQTFQLIRGGQDPSLRLHSTRAALKQIALGGELPSEQVDILLSAYAFLRKTEHVLQELNDAQTQTLPSDEHDQLRLAIVCGFNHYSDFYTELTAQLAKVHQVFKSVIADPETQHEHEAEFDYWLDGVKPETIQEHIEHTHSHLNHVAIAEQIIQAKETLDKRHIGPRGRDVLHRLMPWLIDEILNYDHPEMTLSRVAKFISAISTRTTYLELLQENAKACHQLIKLLEASPWIFEQLCKHPVLLDELIDPEQLYKVYNKAQYADDLRQKLLRVEPDDLELQMETLRHFKNTQQLRIAAADVSGILPVMKVSDHLTWLAETILDQVMHLAWQPMVAKHGNPENLSNTNDKGFSILGYGKLGGWELGYGSDLDMVFVHNQDINTNTTGDNNGARSISIPQFYIRFAQKMIHLMATRTHSGILYEVDMRLRPSGNSGLLVTSVQGFEDYQKNDAWTWEHQALVRCRSVAGDQNLAQTLNDVRHRILCMLRESHQLQKEVTEMRDKMRKHLAKGTETEFDIKQDTGGIADIEFITQYLVLNYSEHHPALTQWSDNVRILETAEKNQIISPEQAETLIESYLTLRNKGHRLALAQQEVITEAQAFQQIRESVIKVWQSILENT